MWGEFGVASSSAVLTAAPKRDCSRECMTNIVTEILQSMESNNPYNLPLAQEYRATENSHPAALGMMTLWRTVTKASPPNLLAIHMTTGSAYFALDIIEGNAQKQSVLWARIKVIHQQITELELYINRSRGDHGFSFSPEELPTNYARWMSPPPNRQIANRTELESLSAATFNPSYNFLVTIASNCQFTEEGWSVIDPGPDGNGSCTPLGCSWPAVRPTDMNARLNLGVDGVMGIVVTGAVVQGKVYPYGKISAFIPDIMTTSQEEQDEWLRVKKEEGARGLLAPSNVTGETLQVLQYYDAQLQGQQVMLYLSGPDMKSVWVD
ncbi:hypothetical protein BO78DRAFT_453339 [Aspergillus sclerotiicarbonarius CBS 121057]|uniref:Uncharacterized protein n=1 Tax=Aspergillus sclerotiicarbonarius (strain CBS 121057 / IBT 28362) TaxID=1448318 RepID=A0A319E828_ASPSB|nr:hypothetical protein BO78DRAFT_453339 [Aspergillus sclerotiicarbonarius CBS 121057]